MSTDQASRRTGSKLADRVALVTGGTRGIGAAISRSLAGQGASVAMGYGRDHERAQEFLAELQQTYPDGSFSVHPGNVATAGDCRKTIQDVIDAHGNLIQTQSKNGQCIGFIHLRHSCRRLGLSLGDRSILTRNVADRTHGIAKQILVIGLVHPSIIADLMP